MSQACITGDVTGVRRRDVSQGDLTRWCNRMPGESQGCVTGDVSQGCVTDSVIDGGHRDMSQMCLRLSTLHAA
jgi:hypothetical protein